MAKEQLISLDFYIEGWTQVGGAAASSASAARLQGDFEPAREILSEEKKVTSEQGKWRNSKGAQRNLLS